MEIKSLIKLFLIPAILFAALFVFGNEVKAATTTYYVSPTGNDNNAGTEASPFRKIQRAADIVNPGDTVYVRAGTYNERVKLTRSGIAGKYITFQNYPNETAILDGGGSGNLWTYMVIGENISYFKLIGFKMNNFKGNGISFNGAGSHIEIRNNDISNISGESGRAISVFAYIWVGSPVYYSMSDIIIDGNNIHDFYTGLRYVAEVIVIAFDVSRFQITNNILTHVQNIGINAVGKRYNLYPPHQEMNRYPHNGIISENNITNWGGPYVENSGLYIDGGHDITIENNFLNGGQAGIVVSVEQSTAVTENIIVRRNIVKNAFISMFIGATRYGGNTNHSRYVHNTIATNTTGKAYALFLSKGSDLIVKNNIVYFGSTGTFSMIDNALEVSTNPTLDYNNFFPASQIALSWTYGYSNNTYSSFSAYSIATGQDAHSITTDPKFTNVVSNDFTLRAGSPAIDTGDFLTRTTSSGTGTIIPVLDARYFHNGYGIEGVSGDIIRVGSNTVTVTDVNYETNTITIDRSISWNKGDGVSYPYSGSKPDIGAFQSGGDMTAPAAPSGLTVQ